MWYILRENGSKISSEEFERTRDEVIGTAKQYQALAIVMKRTYPVIQVSTFPADRIIEAKVRETAPLNVADGFHKSIVDKFKDSKWDFKVQ